MTMKDDLTRLMTHYCVNCGRCGKHPENECFVMEIGLRNGITQITREEKVVTEYSVYWKNEK